MKKKYIVVPTYNERENIERLLRSIFLHVPDAHVMIVDDNSPDGTGSIVEALMIEFPNIEILKRSGKQGLGKAYIQAFKKILARNNAETIVMMDADLSHDPAALPAMFKLQEKADVVTGSRYIKGGSIEGWELWRRGLSFGGNLYARAILRMGISDLTGGFNVMNAETLSRVDLDNIKASGYAFIMELKHGLFKQHARFVEYPITFVNRTEGESKISNHIIKEGVFAPWGIIFKK